MVRSGNARRRGKVGTVTINVVARWIRITAIRNNTSAGGASASKYILEMIEASDTRRKVSAVAVNVVTRWIHSTAV